MTEAKIFQLWPICLYKSSFDIDEDTKQLFYNEEYERMPSGNGDYTKNKYLLHDKKYSYVIENIMKHLNGFTKKYMTVNDEVSFYLQNSWAVKHNGNDWGQTHSHANSLFSGVLYLDTPKDSGAILFDAETRPTWSTRTIEPKLDEHTILNSRSYRIEPHRGMSLVFPSHMNHSVELNRSGQNRYSLAYDVMMWW